MAKTPTHKGTLPPLDKKGPTIVIQIHPIDDEAQAAEAQAKRKFPKASPQKLGEILRGG